MPGGIGPIFLCSTRTVANSLSSCKLCVNSFGRQHGAVFPTSATFMRWATRAWVLNPQTCRLQASPPSCASIWRRQPTVGHPWQIDPETVPCRSGSTLVRSRVDPVCGSMPGRSRLDGRQGASMHPQSRNDPWSLRIDPGPIPDPPSPNTSVIECRPLIDPESIIRSTRNYVTIRIDSDRSPDNRMMMTGLSLVEIRVDP